MEEFEGAHDQEQVETSVHAGGVPLSYVLDERCEFDGLGKYRFEWRRGSEEPPEDFESASSSPSPGGMASDRQV